MSLYDSFLRHCMPLALKESLKESALCQGVARALGRGKREAAPPPSIAETEFYEPEVRRAIERLVKPGWVCVDVGANVGMIASKLARSVGETGRVVAMEAYPGNIPRLRRRMEELGLSERVEIVNIAVTDGAQATVALHAGRSRSHAEWNILGHDLEGQATAPEMEVPATSLDQYFKPGERIDFIKLDIEGAGVLALPGMRRIANEQKPAMLIEFHDEAEWAAREVLLNAGCLFYDLEGNLIKSEAGAERPYQCLALAGDAAGARA